MTIQKPLAIDLFCGLDLGDSELNCRADSMIQKLVACRAENPDHVFLCVRGQAPSTIALEVWFMCYFKDAGFTASFTCSWHIRISALESIQSHIFPARVSTFLLIFWTPFFIFSARPNASQFTGRFCGTLCGAIALIGIWWNNLKMFSAQAAISTVFGSSFMLFSPYSASALCAVTTAPFCNDRIARSWKYHNMTKPLMVDLYAGLGGWAEGGIAEGYEVIGFDIEQHVYGDERYPAQLVLQDVMTLHGRQFKDAALIVASPPCQAYSYRAMPWKKAKALGPPDNSLFEACFRIQREASEAAGRFIPLVVENVRGAQPYVGRSRWNFGSFHLWGDVPALMPMTGYRKVPGFRFDGSGKSFQTAAVEYTGYKSSGLNWSDQSKRGQDFTRIAGNQAAGIKQGGDWFNETGPGQLRSHGPKSPARKRASAMIAKIPLVLSRHIAACWKPK